MLCGDNYCFVRIMTRIIIINLLWLMIVYIALLVFAVDLIIIILINSIIVLNTIVCVTGSIYEL